MKVFVIIPAAGLGTRMAPAGKKVAASKQLFEISGAPILIHTLRAFARHPQQTIDIVAILAAIGNLPTNSPQLAWAQVRDYFPPKCEVTHTSTKVCVVKAIWLFCDRCGLHLWVANQACTVRWGLVMKRLSNVAWWWIARQQYRFRHRIARKDDDGDWRIHLTCTNRR